MRTVFITSFHPLISRNILSTEIIAKLANSGIKIVILAANYKKEYFERVYGGKNIEIAGVETGPVSRSKITGLFKKINEALPDTQRAFMGRHLTLTGKKKSPFIYYFFYWPISLFGKSFVLMRVIRTLDSFLTPRGRFYKILNSYKPDLIFSTDIQNEHDVSLLQDAKRKKVPSIAMVRSWDNLVTRGLRFIPSKIIVHNEIIKDQAIKLYGIRSESIAVTGIPHYDRYKITPTEKRREFLKRMNLDPNKKLIVYFPLCDYRLVGGGTKADLEVLNILSEFGENVIVRMPPAETVDFKGFRGSANVVFDQSGFAFDENMVTNRELTPEDDRRLISELYFTDVAVAGPSTAAIDAAIMDKPIILANFYPDKLFEYRSEHFIPIIESGGLRMARGKNELLQQIKNYLEDPSLDREGRKRIVEEQCWKFDGKSSQRVADYILSQLQNEH